MGKIRYIALFIILSVLTTSEINAQIDLDKTLDASDAGKRILSIIGGTPDSDEELNSRIEFEICPDFLAEDLEGFEHKLIDYNGQIVVLHFWRVYSKNSLMDLDFLSAIRSSNAGKIEVITFSNYHKMDIDPYFKRIGYETDLAIVPDGFNLPNELLVDYGIASPECTLIIDEEGRFRHIVQAHGRSGTNAYHTKIQQALDSILRI